MRHGKKIHKLERPKAHRVALMANLASALITHKRIKTTEAKAKALKPMIDKLITTAKQNTVNARRIVAKTIRSRETLKKLFDEIAPEMIGRTSGYSRIMRVGQRKGDGAQVVMIELIIEQVEQKEEAQKKGKKRQFFKKAMPLKEKQVEVKESVPVQETEKSPKPETEVKTDAAETSETPAPEVKLEGVEESPTDSEQKPADDSGAEEAKPEKKPDE